MNSTKELQLTMLERAIFSDILPQQGNKLQQIIVRSLREQIKFTEEEIEKFEISATSNGIKWNGEKTECSIFSFSLSEVEISIIKEASAIIDSEKRVNQHNLSLLEKIDAL